MSEPFSYFNGEFIPAAQLAVPVYDAGFVLGASVTEQLRTFGGRLFRLDEHLRRLERSLEIVGVELPDGLAELRRAAEELTARNHALLEDGDDLGLAVFVTPGAFATLAPPGTRTGPNVCLHTYPLPFDQWAGKYRHGQPLATTGIRQVPPDCWPAELKCRSRMHYFLADRQAEDRFPGAKALLLDEQDHVRETSTANVLAYFPTRGLVTPPLDQVLPGVSLTAVRELAERLGIPFEYAEITADELVQSNEVLLTSTPWCLLPVLTFDGQPIGTSEPGEVYRRLLAAFSELVGLDVAQQARRRSGYGKSVSPIR